MQIVKPKVIIPERTMLKLLAPEFWILGGLEDGARVCYQSYNNKTKDGKSAEALLGNCIKTGHTSTLEHESLTFNFICDRGLSHELVRHRLASYSQESTRFCKYKDGNMEFIDMIEFNPAAYKESDLPVINKLRSLWEDSCKHDEHIYCEMMKILEDKEIKKELKLSPASTARHALNNSLKTEIVITRNPRNMREFLTLRCAIDAHMHARELSIALLKLLQQFIPTLFDDITCDTDFFERYMCNDWKQYIYVGTTYNRLITLDEFFKEFHQGESGYGHMFGVYTECVDQKWNDFTKKIEGGIK